MNIRLQVAEIMGAQAEEPATGNPWTIAGMLHCKTHACGSTLMTVVYAELKHAQLPSQHLASSVISALDRGAAGAL